MLQRNIKPNEPYALQSQVFVSLFFLPVIPVQRFYIASAGLHTTPSALTIFCGIIKKPSAVIAFFNPP